MMIGCTNLLSVIRVTTVSVKVLFVIVSVTRPKPEGASGNSMPFNNFFSGFLIVSETTLVESLFSLPSDSTPLCRKWGGIIAWKSSLVSGFDAPYMSRGQYTYIVSKTVIKRNKIPKYRVLRYRIHHPVMANMMTKFAKCARIFADFRENRYWAVEPNTL